MATTYEIFCERCGTRHVDKPAPAERAGRLRGLLRSSSTDDKAQASHPDKAFDGAFLRVCLSCRGYACANCWNNDSGFCLDCAPADEASFAPSAATDAPIAPSVGPDGAGPVADRDRVPDQTADAASPTVSDWPAADLTELWDQPMAGEESQANASADSFAPAPDTWPTQDLAVVEAYPLLAEMGDPTGQSTDGNVEASLEAPATGLEWPAEVAGQTEDAEGADSPDSDLLSEGSDADELPLFELSAILAQFSPDGNAAVGETEPVAEAVADVEAVAAAVGETEPVAEAVADVEAVLAAVGETEPVAEAVADVEAVLAVGETEPVAEIEPAGYVPVVQAVVDLELEPRAEMLIPVDPEPVGELVAEATVEPEPLVELVAEPTVEPVPPVELEAEPAVEPEPAVDLDAEPAVGPEPTVEPEPAVEPEPLVELAAEPTVDLVSEPAVEPEPLVELEAQPAVGPEPTVEPEPAVEPEPPVELAAEPAVEPEPPVELVAEPAVEPEPADELVAEPEPVSTLFEPAPIPMPAPPGPDVIWPPAGPAGYRPETDPTPAIQPVLAFHPSPQRRRTSSPTAVAARRPLPRELAMVTVVPQIRDCPNCQLPISVRARFCRRCGTSQVSA